MASQSHSGGPGDGGSEEEERIKQNLLILQGLVFCTLSKALDGSKKREMMSAFGHLKTISKGDSTHTAFFASLCANCFISPLHKTS